MALSAALGPPDNADSGADRGGGIVASSGGAALNIGALAPGRESIPGSLIDDGAFPGVSGAPGFATANAFKS